MRNESEIPIERPKLTEPPRTMIALIEKVKFDLSSKLRHDSFEAYYEE